MTMGAEHRFACCCVLLIFVSFGSARAASQGRTLTELVDMPFEELLKVPVEVASTTAETVFKTPSTVSVIDRDTIRRYQFHSISEAVDTVAGLSVGRTYLKRNLPTSRGILQDHYANKVLVMINGVPTWHAVTGEGNLDRIGIEEVERIEVLKGPASVLYGTNAYSGAVNLVLRDSKDSPARVYGRVGDGGVLEGGGHTSLELGGVSAFVAANGKLEDGQSFTFVDEAGVTGKVNEYLRPKNVTVSATRGRHSLLFNSFSTEESYLGVVPTLAGGAGNPHEVGGFLIDYGYRQPLGDKADFNYDLSYDEGERDLSRNAADTTRSNILGYRVQHSAKASYRFAKNLRAVVGGAHDYRFSNRYRNYNTVTGASLAENDLQNKELWEYSLFGEANWETGRWDLSAGTRRTENELFGGDLSSRAAAVYSVNDRTSYKLLVGQSYRSPSLFELQFATPEQTVFGNSALEPEKSTSYELAYLTSVDRLFLQLVGYRASYENKIGRVSRFVPAAGRTALVYDNGGEFFANGLELEARYHVPKGANLFLNYGLAAGDGGDEAAGNGHYNFKYVPRHTVSLGAAKDLGDFSVSSVCGYRSGTSGPEGPIDGQVTVDVNLGYMEKGKLTTIEHVLSAKNLFDERGLEPEYVRRNGLNELPSGAGRQIVYSVKMRF